MEIDEGSTADRKADETLRGKAVVDLTLDVFSVLLQEANQLPIIKDWHTRALSMQTERAYAMHIHSIWHTFSSNQIHFPISLQRCSNPLCIYGRRPSVYHRIMLFKKWFMSLMSTSLLLAPWLLVSGYCSTVPRCSSPVSKGDRTKGTLQWSQHS